MCDVCILPFRLYVHVFYLCACVCSHTKRTRRGRGRGGEQDETLSASLRLADPPGGLAEKAEQSIKSRTIN